MSTVKFYAGDDVQTPFKRANKTPKPTKLRESIKPGTVLIILSGRFRGRRVVFLKQLQSGLLLVTGPYKVNGVPLRRVSQAYVIPTSTTVNLNGVNASAINDDFFKKFGQTKAASGNQFFAEGAQESEESKKNREHKRKTQATIDQALLNSVKAVPHLKQYLGARFSLKNGQFPHLMKF